MTRQVASRACTVVIPVYREGPGPVEVASLRQVRKVLREFDTVLVAPQGLDVSAYLRIAPDVRVENFPERFFASTATYSRLLLDSSFYDRFGESEYILIYQLDAWVFRNELLAWCDQGYAYVGAPWFKVGSFRFMWRRHRRVAIGMLRRRRWRNCVGNGGLSLRHTFSALRVLQEHATAADAWDSNEDHFWSLYAPTVDFRFVVPDWRIAARFALEHRASEVARKLNIDTPFGCHAWQRYEPEYWAQHISVRGL